MVVAPRLGTTAPRAEAHRVHDAAAATPIAAGVVLESLRRFERFFAGALILDVAATPGTEREGVRDDPAAVRAFGSGLALRVGPLELATAAGTVAPEPLELGMASRAAQLGGRDFALAHRATASSTMR